MSERCSICGECEQADFDQVDQAKKEKNGCRGEGEMTCSPSTTYD